MTDESIHEIGGYFELALPDFGDPFPAPFMKFQSARSSLRAVLHASDFKRVLVPAYICDSVVDAIEDAGLATDFYHLDDRLAPIIPAALSEEVALLQVNYFGLCESNADRFTSSCPPRQLIMDNTQALFCEPTQALATIYSPRKFMGLPDGGLLVARGIDVPEPEHEDVGSLARMEHLLVRLASTAREGYAHFVASNRSLEETRPLSMSRLTRRLLRSIDMNGVRQRRRANFQHLAESFDDVNVRHWVLGPESVPLCYPLILNEHAGDLKKQLADENIYIPTFWEDARSRIDNSGVEAALLDRCLPLPCDQRYTSEQIDWLVSIVMSRLASR